jgi:hypothetical protein
MEMDVIIVATLSLRRRPCPPGKNATGKIQRPEFFQHPLVRLAGSAVS